MSNCKMCKKTMFFSNKKVCNNCKNLIVYDCKLRIEGVEKLRNQINNGFKKLDSYLSRYQIAFESMKDIYEYQKLIPHEFTIEPKTYDEWESNTLNEIQNLVSLRKKQAIYKFEQTGDIMYLKDIKKLRTEILDLQLKYPQFKKLLAYDELQQYIDDIK